MTWFIVSALTKPIEEIIAAVKPYQEGSQRQLPKIEIGAAQKSVEFIKLADTLNSLSAKVQDQIDSITEERNEKAVLLESLLEGVIAVDSGMHITFANTSALKILGMDKNSLIGRPFSEAGMPQCEHLLKRCQKEGTPLTDAIHITHEEKKLYFDIVASPKKDNTGALLVMQDKTEHYRIMDMRKDFIANASHELKTPITIIRGFAETLHDNPDLPKETILEILNKILRNSQRMGKLVKDLLTLADIENLPESRMSVCDIAGLTDKCIAHVQESFPTAQIKVEPAGEGPFELHADSSLLEMALMNLIHNAAKYSTPPAEILISIKREGKNLEWKIADKGIGIPEEALEHIFERFYTVNRAHSQKMGGSGLGLSIVETIVGKHQGKVSVESTVGAGTTFTVLLPIGL
jgi:PAS domain S-box-containing protein